MIISQGNPSLRPLKHQTPPGEYSLCALAQLYCFRSLSRQGLRSRQALIQQNSRSVKAVTSTVYMEKLIEFIELIVHGFFGGGADLLNEKKLLCLCANFARRFSLIIVKCCLKEAEKRLFFAAPLIK